MMYITAFGDPRPFACRRCPPVASRHGLLEVMEDARRCFLLFETATTLRHCNLGFVLTWLPRKEAKSGVINWTP